MMRAPWRVALLVTATACAVISSACRDNPFDPGIDGPLRPQFHHNAAWVHCRYFGSGTALTWVGPSHWEGACPTQPIASPVPYMGSGNPGTVTFTFTAAVFDIRSAAIYPCPPTCPTTHMSFYAYAPDGSLVIPQPDGGAELPPQPFDGDVVGSTTYYSFDTLDKGLIQQVVLFPAEPAVPAQFLFDYSVPCPPVGDPIIESPEVRQGLINALTQSGREPSAKEIGGFIFQRSDGTYFTEIVPDPAATSCANELPTQPGPRTDGAVAVGQFHTHPHTDGEEYKAGTSCQAAINAINSGHKAHAYPLSRGGGGSPNDWARSQPDRPMYTVTYDDKAGKFRVHRLDHGTAESDRPKNKTKWRIDSTSGVKCATRV